MDVVVAAGVVLRAHPISEATHVVPNLLDAVGERSIGGGDEPVFQSVAEPVVVVIVLKTTQGTYGLAIRRVGLTDLRDVFVPQSFPLLLSGVVVVP